MTVLIQQIDPNWIAYLAIALWPVVTIILYSRLSVTRATAYTILGAFLSIADRR